MLEPPLTRWCDQNEVNKYGGSHPRGQSLLRYQPDRLWYHYRKLGWDLEILRNGHQNVTQMNIKQITKLGPGLKVLRDPPPPQKSNIRFCCDWLWFQRGTGNVPFLEGPCCLGGLCLRLTSVLKCAYFDRGITLPGRRLVLVFRRIRDDSVSVCERWLLRLSRRVRWARCVGSEIASVRHNLSSVWINQLSLRLRLLSRYIGMPKWFVPLHKCRA